MTSLYARRDLVHVFVAVTDGGCGQGHSRPVWDGMPLPTWELKCSKCTLSLKDDVNWSATQGEIPETYDEKIAREDAERRNTTLKEVKREANQDMLLDIMKQNQEMQRQNAELQKQLLELQIGQVSQVGGKWQVANESHPEPELASTQVAGKSDGKVISPPPPTTTRPPINRPQTRPQTRPTQSTGKLQTQETS
jgi:hypothetical protein